MTYSQRVTFRILAILGKHPDGVTADDPRWHLLPGRSLRARLAWLRRDGLALDREGVWRATPKGVAVLAVLGSPLPEDAYRVACGWANVRAKPSGPKAAGLRLQTGCLRARSVSAPSVVKPVDTGGLEPPEVYNTSCGFESRPQHIFWSLPGHYWHA